MSYFHVLLYSEASPNTPQCVFWDLSEKELKTKFVAPYRKGRDLLREAEVIKLSEVRRVQIVETPRTNEAERADILAKSKREMDAINSQGGPILVGFVRGYQSSDIVDAGCDVTEKYISGPPGYASGSRFARAFNHPWVLAIGAGLLVVYIAWRLGWN